MTSHASSSQARTWYPVIVIDEVLPEGKTSPEDWMTEPFIRDLYPPTSIIEFKWTENHGFKTLAFDQTGQLLRGETCLETMDMFPDSMPQLKPGQTEPSNSFWHPDYELFAATAEDMAAQLADALAAEFDPDNPVLEEDVQAAYWSGKIRFRVNPDGKTLTEIPASEILATEITEQGEA